MLVITSFENNELARRQDGTKFMWIFNKNRTRLSFKSIEELNKLGVSTVFVMPEHLLRCPPICLEIIFWRLEEMASAIMRT